ncbi:hypothetical protein N6L24_13995 [Cognatishimia sp. SS12]|uniref:hypothetical protein n=1 Tax=Cognatishimia sp. SS12 TaxID=2979465 RepID=UPI00232F5AC6|nr:hypothetical protein [Cognatishimia sp. SS12]MDC0739396.1 hypothetical protein [Cognatishimia sp. SS12]
MTPTDRACLQYAVHVALGLDHAYVTPDGACVMVDSIDRFDPSSNPLDAVITTLAQMMKLHLGGVGFGELRNDLLRSGVREQFANRVHDHLVDVSVEEWAALRARIRWYGDDTGEPLPASTEVQGES